MRYLYTVVFALSVCSCTMFSKSNEGRGPSELQGLTQDVLKRGEGVEIDIKPIIMPKK